ncbi:hypothetical protein [Acidipila sp. EB88]|uniref:hypothetical protein n=1 Tax=Acidipila sp. EB88 TaxID=2305226 RepID=UPI000F5FDBFF|nr:hypothetical protein [Acidipila sp. EB88]RRA49157.1 hypothetical protein D1Y84_13640 [Acidipila sp. EB88]
MISFLLLAALTAPSALPAQTTLPVIFPHTVSAKDAQVGKSVEAKTTAPVRLASGEVIPKGAKVSGHVVEATPFVWDSTPYAKQKAAVLAVQFDSVDDRGVAIPLHVALRAMADPLSSWDADRPLPSDVDHSGTTTQVGGDQNTPWIKEVTSSDGDIVGYHHNGFVYAHLLGSGTCDASDTEQAMGIFSASACGLYGMPQESVESKPSASGVTVVLHSTKRNVEIHANAQALLEESAATLQADAR